MPTRPPAPSIQGLRLVLRANAVVSLVTGVIALVAGSWLSRELGIDHVALTRVIGAGLIIFAVDVAMVARAKEPKLLQEAGLVSMADIAWVVATAVVVMSGILTTAGNVVAVAQGLVITDFAATQLWFRSRAPQPEATATVAV